MSNKYLKNLNRLEFIVTWACSGKCIHCSQGDHSCAGVCISADKAKSALLAVVQEYRIDSVMVFGGEPLLHPDVTCGILDTAAKCGIPKRQLITNGYFSKDVSFIKNTVSILNDCRVNDILLSVDAFHQQTIPVEYVKLFAEECNKYSLPIRLNPAWLVSKDDGNEYNKLTRSLLDEFVRIGIPEGDGNVIFPEGNALVHLKEYFDPEREYINPYVDDAYDVRSISFEPDGTVLEGNIYNEDVMKILDRYLPT